MPTSTDLDRIAYNKYSQLPTFPYLCIQHLMNKDELVWKLLKYNTPDAWNRSDLTKTEKGALIWNGLGDSSDFKVFMDEGFPDVETREDTIVRITPNGIYPDGRTVGTLVMMFEVYSHFKINTLSNYTTRTDTIIQRLIEVFNGEKIDGIGRLFFSKPGLGSAKMQTGGQIPFKGKWMFMGVKLA